MEFQERLRQIDRLEIDRLVSLLNQKKKKKKEFFGKIFLSKNSSKSKAFLLVLDLTATFRSIWEMHSRDISEKKKSFKNA